MSLPEFAVNPPRFDPYKNFKFRLKLDGAEVAGVSAVSGLEATPLVVKHREGGDPSLKGTGRTKHESITLERGVTHDPGFQQWASEAGANNPPNSVDTKPELKDFVIEIHDEAGRLADAYTFLRCRVSDYQSLPDLDAGANAVAIQVLKLEYEGRKKEI